MTDPERLDRLFAEALTRPAAERPEFVVAACGEDAELLRELEELLRAHDAAGAFLEDPTPWLAGLPPAPGVTPRETRPTSGGSWIGRTLSHYEILEPIAAGGMGVVYKARDTRLDRLVTLKFLHPHLPPKPDVIERFVHEAQAASALDHPNICTIYEIEEAPDGQLFIVMAYYEGETLKDRLSRGPLPLAEALRIARGIAAGLERAHDAGIVHRDLKPANVMLTERGEVKILDFGIAKLEGATGITESGVRLGTLAYMSPEQVRGDPVDHRTDIWALGVVLAEMLTGARPFAGDNEAAQLHAILHDDPALPADLLPDVVRVTRAALARDPAGRFPSMAAFGTALDALMAGHTPPGLPVVAGRRRLRPLVYVLAVGAVAVAAALVARRGDRGRPAGVPRPQQVTFAGDVLEATLSGDGRFIAFIREGATSQLLVREVGGGTALPVYSTDSSFFCCAQWSPDGRLLAIREGTRAEGRTLIMPRLGGRPRAIRSEVISAWSPDGTRLVSWWPQAQRLWFTDVVTGDTTASVPLTMPHEWVNGVDWSPDGSHVVVATRDDVGLWSVATDGSTSQRIVSDTVQLSSPRWSTTGLVYYLRGGDRRALELWRVPVTGAGALAGRPTLVLSGLAVGMRHQSIPVLSLTADGATLLYPRSVEHSNLVLYSLGGDQPLAGRSLTSGTATRSDPRFSPDGENILFIEWTAGGGNVFVVPTQGGTPRQLSFHRAEIRAAAWSPDGRRVAFASAQGGTPRVWIADADGGAARPIAGTHPTTRLAWAPAQQIHYLSLGQHDYQVLDPETGASRELLGGNDYGWLYQPRPSPDGRWVAVAWVRPGDDDGLWLISTRDSSHRPLRIGFAPIGWTAQSDSVYAVPMGAAPDEPVPAVYVIPLTGGEVRLIAELPDGVSARDVAITRDGSAIVVAVRVRQTDAWLIDQFDPLER